MNRNETFPALSVSTLAIHLAWASLEIIVSDVEDIQLMVSGEDSFVSELKLALTDGCLAVEQPSYGLSIKLKNERWMQVLVRLPRSWKGGVTAGTVSGTLSSRGLTGTDIALSTVSGSLHAESLAGINLTLHTVSGAILASDLAGDSLALRTVSGGVKLSGGEGKFSGTFFGILIYFIINTIFTYLPSGISVHWQSIIMGLLVLVSVGVQSEVFQSLKLKKKAGDAV